MGKGFWVQLVIRVLVIMLVLGFHTLYVAITICLMNSGGSSRCWIVSWLGVNIHASFYIDVVLYSIIMVEVISMLILIRNKFLSRG